MMQNLNAMMQPVNNGGALQSGYDQGNNATGGMSAASTLAFAQQNGVTLSPEQQIALQQKAAQEAAVQQAGMQSQLYGVGAAVGNNIANANAQRSMAIAAQQNAAANTANQLAQLGQARATNTQAIQSALGGTAGQFR